MADTNKREQQRSASNLSGRSAEAHGELIHIPNTRDRPDKEADEVQSAPG
ncbi:hypothetical protein [Streptomyces fagopyri]